MAKEKRQGPFQLELDGKGTVCVPWWPWGPALAAPSISRSRGVRVLLCVLGGALALAYAWFLFEGFKGRHHGLAYVLPAGLLLYALIRRAACWGWKRVESEPAERRVESWRRSLPVWAKLCLLLLPLAAFLVLAVPVLQAAKIRVGSHLYALTWLLGIGLALRLFSRPTAWMKNADPARPGLADFGVFYLVHFTILVALLILERSLRAPRSGILRIHQVDDWSQASRFILHGFLLIATVWGVLKARGGADPLRRLGFVPVGSKEVLHALLWGSGLFVATFIFHRGELPIYLRPGISFLLLGLAVLEFEVSYRGFFYPVMDRVLGRIGATVVVAVIFSLNQELTNLPVIASALVAGLVLNESYRRSRSLWPPILIHGTLWTLLVALSVLRWSHPANQGWALDWAIRNFGSHEVRDLLERGADPSRSKDGKTTPLHLAAMRDQAGMVVALLEHGADPKSFDKSGTTPLMCAAWNGSMNALSVLAKVSDPSQRDSKGLDALMHAFRKKRCAAAEYLLSTEPDLSGLDAKGHGVLLHTALGGCWDLVPVLLDRGAPVEVPGQANDMTALSVAVGHDKGDIVRRLLEKGADPRIRNANKETVYHRAIRWNKRAMLDMLLKHSRHPRDHRLQKELILLARRAGSTDMVALLGGER